MRLLWPCRVSRICAVPCWATAAFRMMRAPPPACRAESEQRRWRWLLHALEGLCCVELPPLLCHHHLVWLRSASFWEHLPSAWSPEQGPDARPPAWLALPPAYMMQPVLSSTHHELTHCALTGQESALQIVRTTRLHSMKSGNTLRGIPLIHKGARQALWGSVPSIWRPRSTQGAAR